MAAQEFELTQRRQAAYARSEGYHMADATVEVQDKAPQEVQREEKRLSRKEEAKKAHEERLRHIAAMTNAKDVEGHALQAVTNFHKRIENNIRNIDRIPQETLNRDYEELVALQSKLQELFLQDKTAGTQDRQHLFDMQKNLRAVADTIAQMQAGVPSSEHSHGEDVSLTEISKLVDAQSAAYPVMTFAEAMLGKQKAQALGFNEHATLADLVQAARNLSGEGTGQELSHLKDFGASMQEMAVYLAGQEAPVYQKAEMQEVLRNLYNAGAQIQSASKGEASQTALSKEELQKLGREFVEELQDPTEENLDKRLKLLYFMTTGDKRIAPKAYIGKSRDQLLGVDGRNEKRRLELLAPILLRNLQNGDALGRIRAEIGKGAVTQAEALRGQIAQKAREQILQRNLPQAVKESPLFRQMFGKEANLLTEQKKLGEVASEGLALLREHNASLEEQVRYVNDLVGNHPLFGEKQYTLEESFGEAQTELVCAVRVYILATLLSEQFGSEDIQAITSENQLVESDGIVKGHVRLAIALADGSTIIRLDPSKTDTQRYINLSEAGADPRVLQRVLSEGQDPLAIFDKLDANMFVNAASFEPDTQKKRQLYQEALKLDSKNIIAVLGMASVTDGDEQERYLDIARNLVPESQKGLITKENLQNIEMKVEVLVRPAVIDSILDPAIDYDTRKEILRAIIDQTSPLARAPAGRLEQYSPEDLIAAAITGGGPFRNQWERMLNDPTVIPPSVPPRQATIGAEVRQAIDGLMKEYVEELVTTRMAGPYVDTILPWIGFYNDDTRGNRYKYAEEVMSRIVFHPFMNPTGDYHLPGMYMDPNLTALANIVQRIETKRIRGELTSGWGNIPVSAPVPRPDRENKGSQLSLLKQAAQYYFNMNKIIYSGQIDQFAQFSNAFSSDYFELGKKLSGVAASKRTLEMSLRDVLDKDGTIDDLNKDNVVHMLEHIIEVQNHANIFEGFGTSGNLAEWEEERARYMSESMFNVEFRTPEVESIGGVNRVSGIASTHLEFARRITDWFGHMGRRFGIDEVQGGLPFIQRIIEAYETGLERRFSWIHVHKHMRLAKFGNIGTGEREIKGIFMARGVWDGYRLDAGLLDQVVLEVPDATSRTGGTIKKSFSELFGGGGARAATLAQLVGEARTRQIYDEIFKKVLRSGVETSRFEAAITELSGARKGHLRSPEKLTTTDLLNAAKMITSSAGIERMNKILQDVYVNTHVIEHMTINLGPMISSGAINHPNLYFLRQKLWEQTAQYDPLVAASLLTSLEFKHEEHRSVNSLEEILNAQLGLGYNAGRDQGSKDDPNHVLKNRGAILNDPRWNAVKEELLIAHEARIKASNGGVVPGRFQGGIFNVATPLDYAAVAGRVEARGVGLTRANVISILNAIRDGGIAISQDLSLVRFPNAAFLDDAVFEQAGYNVMGSGFFKRRAGSDLPAFAQAQKAIGDLVNKVAEMKEEEVVKAFATVIDTAGAVLGADVAQDNIVYPMLEAYDEMQEEYWQYENIPGAGLLKIGAELMEKPRSELQQYGGLKAPARDKFERAGFANMLLAAGVLRRAGRGVVEVGDNLYAQTWADSYFDFRRRRKISPGGLFFRLMREIFQAFATSLVTKTVGAGVNIKAAAEGK